MFVVVYKNVDVFEKMLKFIFATSPFWRNAKFHVVLVVVLVLVT